MTSSTSAPHGIGELLSHALELYRAHARTFVIAAGIALVPIYLLHALLTATLLPQASGSRLEARSQRMEERSRELERHAQDGTLTSADALRAQQDLLADASANLGEAGRAGLGLGAFLLSMMLLVPLSMLGTFFGTAAIIPLVDDRERGGSLSPGEAWSKVGAHAVPLVVTAVLAAVAVCVGLFFLVVPGLILGFLFAFAAPVVMLEDKAGVLALRTSLKLVVANLVPTAVVLVALALLTGFARGIAGLLIPNSWVFLHTLVPDLVSLLVFPLPVIGLVLLYRDAHQTAQAQQQLGGPIAAH